MHVFAHIDGLYMTGQTMENGCVIEIDDTGRVWSAIRSDDTDRQTYWITWEKNQKVIRFVNDRNIIVDSDGETEALLSHFWPDVLRIRVQMQCTTWPGDEKECPTRVVDQNQLYRLTTGLWPSFNTLTIKNTGAAARASKWHIDVHNFGETFLAGNTRLATVAGATQTATTDTLTMYTRATRRLKLGASVPYHDTYVLLGLCFNNGVMDVETQPPLNQREMKKIAAPVKLCSYLLQDVFCRRHWWGGDKENYVACTIAWNTLGSKTKNVKFNVAAFAKPVGDEDVKYKWKDVADEMFNEAGVTWDLVPTRRSNRNQEFGVKPNTDDYYYQWTDENDQIIVGIATNRNVLGAQAYARTHPDPIQSSSTQRRNVQNMRRFKVVGHDEYISLAGLFRLCSGLGTELKTITLCRDAYNRLCGSSKACRCHVFVAAGKASQQSLQLKNHGGSHIFDAQMTSIDVLVAVVDSYLKINHFGGISAIPDIETNTPASLFSSGFTFAAATNELVQQPATIKTYSTALLKLPLEKQEKVLEGLAKAFPKRIVPDLIRALIDVLVPNQSFGDGEANMNNYFRGKLAKINAKILQQYVPPLPVIDANTDDDTDVSVLDKHLKAFMETLIKQIVKKSTGANTPFLVIQNKLHTTEQQRAAVCKFILALRHAGMVYSKYEQIGHELNSVLLDQLGFSIFRKRGVWDRCTKEAWGQNKIEESAGVGDSSGSVIEAANVLQHIVHDEKQVKRLDTQQMMCYMMVESTIQRSEAEFETIVFTVLKDYFLFDLVKFGATFVAHREKDYRRWAGHVHVCRKGKPKFDLDGNDIVEEDRWCVMLSLNYDSVDGTENYNTCKVRGNNFFLHTDPDHSPIIRNNLKARIVLRTYPWYNADAFPIWKRSAELSKKQMTEMVMKLPYGTGKIFVHC